MELNLGDQTKLVHQFQKGSPSWISGINVHERGARTVVTEAESATFGNVRFERQVLFGSTLGCHRYVATRDGNVKPLVVLWLNALKLHAFARTRTGREKDSRG